jgi:hypothetical protein
VPQIRGNHWGARAHLLEFFGEDFLGEDFRLASGVAELMELLPMRSLMMPLRMPRGMWLQRRRSVASILRGLVLPFQPPHCAMML